MSLRERWTGLRPDRLTTVWVDGAAAGLAASLVVLAAFAVEDWRQGHPLHTPTALGALFFDGPGGVAPAQAELGRILHYTLVHFGIWLSIGVVGAYLLAASRVYPWLWFVAVLAPALLFGVVLAASGVWGIPGLGVHTLWTGALLGGAAASAVLLWRYPDQLDSLS